MPRVPTTGSYVPEQYATDTKREFNPETETHHFGFTVKAVDPGCTLEFQVEERSGRVTRMTTTDNSAQDEREFYAMIRDAAIRMWQEWQEV